MMTSWRFAVVPIVLLQANVIDAQHVRRRPLAPSDVDAITRLVMMEDRRDFDSTSLSRMVQSDHPDVRRRAALTLARLADSRGREMARELAHDPDSAVAATAVFAVGQLKDSAAVPWLDSVLTAPTSRVTVAREAAGALGKIKTADARQVLARFLTTAPNGVARAAVVGDALLAIGRMPMRGDIAPIIRWSRSANVEVRWRASWALFRPRDPVAVPDLLRLAGDPSPLVRAWAVRGLSGARVDSSGIAQGRATTVLHRALRDPDRTVRTEAVRALGTYQDSASFAALAEGLDSPDSWISVSAAEGLGRMTTFSPAATKVLSAASVSGRRAVRITAMQSLLALSPSDVLPALELLVRDSTATGRLAAVAALRRLPASPVSRRLIEGLVDDADPEVRADARRARDVLSGGRVDSSAQPQASTPRPIETGRTESDYRGIVERWVLPSYQGKAAPVVRWETSRGMIDIELYPGDAPLAVEDLMTSVDAGAIDGFEFERVVPNFVDQQRAIRSTGILRDEVNRRRLTRGNLSWASAGLDTGIPGYTLGITPQPHNEGDFTSLGRVIRGMDVVDRIELGDRVTRVTRRTLPTRR